jgi:hypothetical protein
VTRRTILWTGLLAAAALGFLVARWIVTDREAIERLLVDATKHAERGEWDAVRDVLAEDFESMDRDRFVAKARSFAAAVPTRGWRLEILEILVEGDEAAVRARLHVTPLALRGAWAQEGRIGLVRREGRWRVRSVATDDPRWLR